MKLDSMTREELELLLHELEMRNSGEGTKDIQIRHKVEDMINAKITYEESNYE
jgi:hypothetical protein